RRLGPRSVAAGGPPRRGQGSARCGAAAAAASGAVRDPAAHGRALPALRPDLPPHEGPLRAGGRDVAGRPRGGLRAERGEQVLLREGVPELRRARQPRRPLRGQPSQQVPVPPLLQGVPQLLQRARLQVRRRPRTPGCPRGRLQEQPGEHMLLRGGLLQSRRQENAHAATCERNPANSYECAFCSVAFVTHFTVFGFRSVDGKALRDAHQLCCERNPRNVCFCGRLFSGSAARDRHASICELNPANRFECRHCRSMFVTRYGIMGMVSASGQSVRAAHEVSCEKNPANRCFCGQVFPSPDRRDAHAAVCEFNPVNRFTCQHCDTVCVTTHGLFMKCGSEKLSAHLQVCPKNPANCACEYCGATFSNSQGMRGGWFCGDAKSRCGAHVAVCRQNPRNKFSCRKCDRCFQSRRRWLRRVDGRLARDAHESECDLISCPFEVADAGCQGWVLLAASQAPEAAVEGAALEPGQDWEDCGLLAAAGGLGGRGLPGRAASMGCSSSTTVSGDWPVEDEALEPDTPGGSGRQGAARAPAAAAPRPEGPAPQQQGARARGPPPSGHAGGAEGPPLEPPREGGGAAAPGGFFDAVSEAESWGDACEEEEAQEDSADEPADEGDESETEGALGSRGSQGAEGTVPLAEEGGVAPASDDDAEALAEKQERDAEEEEEGEEDPRRKRDCVRSRPLRSSRGSPVIRGTASAPPLH
ncbi:unnamed protein product, partial [Prorocentrum cordatum]